jgi:hypothetical protein
MTYLIIGILRCVAMAVEKTNGLTTRNPLKDVDELMQVLRTEKYM